MIGLITLCPLQAWALDPPRDIWPSRKGRPAKRTERDAQSLRVTQISLPDAAERGNWIRQVLHLTDADGRRVRIAEHTREIDSR